MSMGSATFNLYWQAPLRTDVTATFIADGNAVNLNGQNSGDGANAATNVLFPLPVHFVNFDLFNLNEQVKIEFETMKEANLKHFEIERSSDGLAFIPIKSLNPKSDGEYSYTDKTIANNIKYYYRIKEVDIDNKYSYSEVRNIVVNTTDLNIKLYPSQVNQKIISVKGLNNYEGLRLEVYSYLGRRVANLKIKDNQFYLNDISNGNYIIRLMKGNEILKKQKITVSN